MKKEKRVIQVIIKSGLITWVLLLLIWQTGSLFYSDDFLPGPVTTFAGAGKLVASGELFRDILISMQRVLKGCLEGIEYLIYTSRLYYKTDWIFIGIFTLGIIGFLADRILQFVGRKALKRFCVR